jgi:hypothetical protein
MRKAVIFRLSNSSAGLTEPKYQRLSHFRLSDDDISGSMRSWSPALVACPRALELEDRDHERRGPRISVLFDKSGLRVQYGTRAWLVDTAFRIPLVGDSGAIDQAFTEAEPVWAATAVVMVAVPLLSRAIEFLIHWLAGTPELLVGVLVSLAFSAVSNPFTLFAMRRGALVVGAEDADSFSRDLLRLPRIAIEFAFRAN